MDSDEVVLAFLLKEAESKEKVPIKFGGKPCWLYPHNSKTFECHQCKQQLTFLCQIYAPLEYEHTFHRAMYIFFCEEIKCQNSKKSFQILRMQLSEKDQFQTFADKSLEGYKTLKEEYFVETEIIDRQELKRIADKVIKEMNENEEDDDEGSDVEDSSSNFKIEPINEEEDMEGVEEIAEKRKLDPIFEVYRGTLSKLNYPVLIYASSPLEFKDQHINVSQKRCSRCKGPMRFEFQINSCLLESFGQLTSYDWGTIQVYTCQDSCKGELNSVAREEVQLQIEEDTALNKEQIQRKLQELDRERLKREKKREKKKQKRDQKRDRKEGKEEEKEEEESGEGDWD